MTHPTPLLRPFETCAVRPPTENGSLTFRLTRNCYWNRCTFCPAHKFGPRFSKRSLEEVTEDIRRAKAIDQYMERAQGGGNELDQAIADEVRRERNESPRTTQNGRPPWNDSDPQLTWFLRWFRESPSLSDSMEHILTWRGTGGKTCFLGDADSLILSPDFFARVMAMVRSSFPSLARFTVYGRTRTAARLRTLEELKRFKEAGLDRVHFGLESGCDRVLRFVKKGASRQEHIEGVLKAREAGLSCSVYVMPGLGGVQWSETHARETADVVSRISPDYVRLRSLQIFSQTPLADAAKKGQFQEPEEEQVVREIKTLLESIKGPTELISDSAANLLDISGVLPRDRQLLSRRIEGFLALSPREKREFSLKSRLAAFVGQYGTVTEDISRALNPYVREDRLDISAADDAELLRVTRMIRAKLMP